MRCIDAGPFVARLGAALVALCTLAPAALSQARQERIVGVVTSGGVAVVDALVSITAAPDRRFVQIHTDSAGAFTGRFEPGTGDYLVHVAAVGYQVVRKRVTAQAGDSIIRVTMELARIQVAKLDTVRIKATIPKPSRAPQFGPEVGARQQIADDIVGSLDPVDASNLGAVTATLPGVTLFNGAPSFLGLSGDQNRMMLNGLSFGGTELPRLADTRVRVTTSAYDPSRGGFSGGQVAVELSPGELYSHRSANLVGFFPGNMTSAPAAAPGAHSQAWRLGLGGNGTLTENSLYYNFGGEYAERATIGSSLETATPEQLANAGLTPALVASSMATLRNAGVPVSASRSPTELLSRRVSFIGRIDHKPFDYTTYQTPARTWSVIGFGQFDQDRGVGRSIASSSSGERDQWQRIASLQGTFSAFIHGTILNETKSGVTARAQRNEPYLAFPSLFISDSAGGALQFGGAADAPSRRSYLSWETTNETQWLSADVQHRFKLYAQSFLESAEQEFDQSAGVYRFQSAADLAAAHASAFTRTQVSGGRSAASWTGALALGDAWQRTPRLSLAYGVRAEMRQWLRTITAPAVTGLAGKEPPSFDVGLSPRLGFSWLYAGGDPGYGEVNSRLGRRFVGYAGTIRGGVGLFRNHIGPEFLLDNSFDARRIQCVGDATPAPNWSGYLAGADAPASCATASGSSPLVDERRSGAIVDHDIRPASSWRANLAWTGRFKPFALTLDGTYSRNLAQSGYLDLARGTTTQFALASEGMRPVFADARAIDPATGIVGAAAPGLVPSYASLRVRDSELRSDSRYLTVALTPTLPFGKYFMNVAYTLGALRAESRGFGSTTAGVPSAVERAPGNADIRHVLNLQLGATANGTTVSLYARAQSGLPYTPLTDLDINGDGYANDRAFIPGEARLGELSTSWHRLIDAAPSRVKDCLLSQRDVAAQQNSCRQGWTVTSNAAISMFGGFHGLPKRLRLTANVSNPVAAVAELATGRVPEWLPLGIVDPVLLNVRGFDPTRLAYRYEVNPHFGRMLPGTMASSPIRVTLEASIDWSVPAARQQLERVLNVGRAGRTGQRLGADSIRRRFARNVPDIYNQVLAQNDSLLLTRSQVDSLRSLATEYRVRTQRIWQELGDHLAALGDSYDKDEALARAEDTAARGWEMNRAEAARIRPVLTEVQWQLLYGEAALVLKGTNKLTLRNFSF